MSTLPQLLCTQAANTCHNATVPPACSSQCGGSSSDKSSVQYGTAQLQHAILITLTLHPQAAAGTKKRGDPMIKDRATATSSATKSHLDRIAPVHTQHCAITPQPDHTFQQHTNLRAGAATMLCN